MTASKTLACAAATLALLAAPLASAQEPVKIGMITTLSTGAGYLGEDIRDAFLLAVEQGGGKLGGVPVGVLVEDDGRKPEQGKQIAERFMKQEDVQIFTGIVFSNIAIATAPGVVRDGRFYISANAGPSALAGKRCHENYFSASWQNDAQHEAAGEYASQQGYKTAFAMAPNYAAGRDAVQGFKRMFKGEIAAEVYTQLGQSDYAAEIAQIRAADPDVVWYFLPGGMGINFFKQYAASGLKGETPMVISMSSMDERIMGAVGEDAVGAINTTFWSPSMDNEASRQFTAAFREKYGRTPTVYGAQGYDTARLIGSALAAVDGDVSDADGFRSALRKADFDSVRGDFEFANNQHPKMDWYVREVQKGPDGQLQNNIIGKVLENHGDVYAAECPMSW